MKRLSSAPSRNAERPLPRGGDDAEGLVREEERRHRALAAGQRELAAERHPVEDVADVQEERRQHDLEPGRAGGEEPDGAELGAAGEDERRQRLGLERARARRCGP